MTDTLFVIDATGSMGTFLVALNETLPELTQASLKLS